MVTILYGILILIIIYTFIKNGKLFSHYKHNNEYIECYKMMLENPNGAIDKIDNYINSESKPEYSNKARLLKLYIELDNCADALDNVNAIDLKSIFYKNDVVDDEKVNIHSDSFVWLIMNVVKANVSKRKDVLKILQAKIDEVSLLETYAEYQCLLNTINMFNKKEYPFFKDLLEGNYVAYKYDKNLIGIYKRIAASNLIYKKEEIDEFFNEDLKAFAGSKIGKLYLKDLGILKKFETIEENK